MLETRCQEKLYWQKLTKMLLNLFPKSGMMVAFTSAGGESCIAESERREVNQTLGAGLGYDVRLNIVAGTTNLTVYATAEIENRRPLALRVVTQYRGTFNDDQIDEDTLQLIGGACLSAPCREPAGDLAAA